MTRPRLSFEDYTVGWICALPIELAAATEMLDEEHQDLSRDATDTNAYSLGRIGEHKVVIACLPAGQTGTNSAAAVASEMRSKFVSIRFGLMVGIGGGVPSAESDIRLGDVVISQPHVQHGGVVQYDFGKTGAGGQFTRTGSLNKPPALLLNALSKLQSNHLRRKGNLSVYLSGLVNRLPHFASEKIEPDILFEPTYDHVGGQTCDKCSRDMTVKRTPRGREEIVVHCGAIASGNRVMKDGITRDKLSLELGGILCFEMEAAGLMNSFPCLVIRGICDYADSHKNKKWQPYAAATAAACAKELLSVIPSAEVAKARTVDEAIDASDKDSQCLRDLRLTDPRDDKVRIESTKDSLIEGSCAWILSDPGFLRWRDNDDTQLLWIKGDPGKGKTMIMISLIDELSNQLKTNPQSGVLSYFFCQSTDTRLNNAVSILRGLIYLLVNEQKTLIRYLREKYDTAGGSLFEGSNALYALWSILSDISNDPSLNAVYLMIDALDECDSGLDELLKLTTHRPSSLSPRVKWFLASRYRPYIEERLQPDGLRQKIILELNPTHISRAVDTFIDVKVSELARQKSYDDRTQKEVKKHLCENSEGTFLWVALVCKRLQEIRPWKVKLQPTKVLKEFPPGLESLYERMMEQIQDGEDTELCTRILSSVTLAYRPIHLKELVSTAGLQEELSEDPESLNELVKLCGSFLTIREGTIYFVHQSAKDYFSTGKGSKIFLLGWAEGHLGITRRSLEAMSNTLRRNMCGLQMPGTLLSKTKINLDRLTHIQYACCYWVDHLRQVDSVQQDQICRSISGNVHIFLQKHFLHWLEALSLIGEISKGVLMITDLQSLFIKLDKQAELLAMINDARRFTLNNRSIIEKAPLQVYSSALVFSPKKSVVRTQFSNQLPAWIKSLPVVEEGWNPSLQTLENQSGYVNSVAFSPDGRRLASGSGDGTVMLWDAETGALQNTLKGHLNSVNSVAFSPGGKWLASGSGDRTVMLWDVETGALQNTLKGHLSIVDSVAFSLDGKRLASGSYDRTVMLWDVETGALQNTSKGHLGSVHSVAFSLDGKRLASGSYDRTVMLWDVETGALQNTLEGHSSSIHSVAFSLGGKQLASGSYDRTVMLWDAETGALQNTLKGHSSLIYSVAFSPDGKQLASGSRDRTVMLWDVETGALQNILKGHLDSVYSVAFPLDGKRLASGSGDRTVMLWDVETGALQNTLEGHSSSVNSVAFSPDGKWLASGSRDGTVMLWDAETGALQNTLEGHLSSVDSVAFSPDGKQLASGLRDGTVMLWDVETGALQNTLKGHSSSVYLVAFSLDGKRLASGSYDRTVMLWDVETGALQNTLKSHSDLVYSVAFSPDGKQLASGSRDRTVMLWDVETGALQNILKSHLDLVYSVAFSPDGKWLASGSRDGTVMLWDAETGALQNTLEGHSSSVNSVAFSPDGKQLASGSYDRTVMLWDVETGALQNTLKGHLDAKIYFQTPLYMLDQTYQWVTWKAHNVLFLPPDRRPSCYAVHDNILAIGHQSGRVTILGFDPNINPLLSEC